jgi:hypothetical protein
MPYLYLHLREGDDLIQDTEGSNYSDLAAAELAALSGLREIVGESLKWGQPVKPLAIVVSDVEGNILATVTLPDATSGILEC